MAPRNKNNRNAYNPDSPLFKGLTKLLSGPIINYRRQNPRQLKRFQLDKFKFKSAAGLPFKKSSYSPFDNIYANTQANQARAERYIDFDQMEYSSLIACIKGDTRIACLEGFFTIEELTERYSDGENFEVWSWDDEKCQYTIGQAHHPRITGEKEVIKINIDNGKFLECTKEHKVMLVDGTYKSAKDLQPGDSLMPFEYKKKEYMHIRSSKNGKFKKVHRYIFENIFDQKIDFLQIHHNNHKKYDNRVENLSVLTAEEHLKIHGRSPITREKIGKVSKDLWKDPVYRERALSGFKRWQNSVEGKEFMSKHATNINKERWANDVEYSRKMSQIFSNHAKKLWQNEEWAKWKKEHHSKIMRLKFANDPDYKNKMRRCGVESGSFYKDITNEEILFEGQKYETLIEFSKKFDFKGRKFKHYNGKVQFLQRRLRSCGYVSWCDYKKNYSYCNHKVVSIEETGKICKVYDLTVDHFSNFCLENGLIISNSALDIYSHEMTTSSPLQTMLKIDCPNEEIKGVLHNLFYDVMNADFNLPGWCRSFCKYGDLFIYLDIDEEQGIQNFIGLPNTEIEKLEGQDKTNPNYVQYQWNSAGMTLETWQVAHFRIQGNDKHDPYGSSILDPIRRIWRQYDLLKNAMMAYRIVRAPERKVIYVDVGGIPDNEVEQYMQKIITEMKKNIVIDADSGQADIRYNPLSIDEDLYIATRGGNTGTRIESLPGGSYPIRQDSDIPLLDGRIITIKQLAEEYEKGKENWVYSVQDKTHSVVPGKVVWCGKNYKCNKIHRVWLDDGSYIDMAPEHPVVLRDGTSLRADELKKNDSIMPFYVETSQKIKEKLKGYPRILNPSSNKYEFVHRLVANSMGGKEEALIRSNEKSAAIHHVDYNKKNNRPNNLKWMGFWEHRNHHWQQNNSISRKNLRKYLFSEEHRINVRKRISNPDDKLHKWIYGEENRNRLIKRNKSLEMRQKTIFRNKKRWEDPEFRKNHSGDNHNLRKKWNKFYSSYSLLDLQKFCKSKNIFYMKDLVSHPESFLKAREQCRKFLQFHGISSWTNFRSKHLDNLKNHKVLDVEILTEIDDVYCMTVVGPNGEDDRHNFAVCGKGVSNPEGKLNGIFVKNTGDVDDVKFLRDELISGLKIPHSYLMKTEGGDEDKESLAQKDIMFAKVIHKLQKNFVSELEKIAVVHLYTLGYRGKDLISFKLALNNPSKIAELQELETWRTKFDVAASATEGYVSRRWVAKKLLGMTDEEFLRNLREIHFDKKFDAEMAKLEAAGEEGEFGEDLLGGEEDLGGEIEGEEEEETLLAAPGKRYDEPYLTPGSKGKLYKQVRDDKRDMGARKRSMRGKYSDETGRNTTRNVFKGYPELRTFSKGIYEQYETNYKQSIDEHCKEYVSKIEEIQILKDNSDIKSLIEGLSKTKLGKKEDENKAQ